MGFGGMPLFASAVPLGKMVIAEMIQNKKLFDLKMIH
jgi:hypothetical protein